MENPFKMFVSLGSFSLIRMKERNSRSLKQISASPNHLLNQIKFDIKKQTQFRYVRTTSLYICFSVGRGIFRYMYLTLISLDSLAFYLFFALKQEGMPLDTCCLGSYRTLFQQKF